MEVRLLGSVAAIAAGGAPIALAGARMRGLLALLALEPRTPVPPGRLVEALWPDPDTTSANALQVAISKFRRALADGGEGDRVVTRPAGYELDIDVDAVDALCFEALVREALRTDDPARAAELLERAEALWRGPALADAPDTSAIVATRVHWEEMLRGAEEERLTAELALGRHAASVARLEAMVTAEPLRERRWALLMQALYGSGQQAEALRAFARAREQLVDTIGAEPGSELRRLEAAVLAQDDAAVLGPVRPAPPAAGPVGRDFRRRGNLRHPVGRLVGCDDGTAELAARVGAHRLVTLTGPGGVGKTRLALEVAAALEEHAREGVWLTELAAARDERDVVAALLRTLGIDDAAGSDPAAATESAVAVLADGDAVLVLDNCEHVLDSARNVVVAVLEACPDVRVITTSRESLGVTGEHLFVVQPLTSDASVTLFVERSAGVGQDATEREVVERICGRLDHLPLGIELAAGRARHLQLDDLLERLTTQFDLPDAASRDAPARQRGLRVVAEWSYQLLHDDERTLFECLSVFADGATVAGAAAVATVRGIAPGDVERLLGRLVDKSLIYVDRSGASTRYRMLQTLYDFSRDRLRESGADAAARDAHAAWVADVASTVAFGARTTGRTVAAVHDEDAAVRDALAWCGTEHPSRALEIADALAPFWFGSMRVSTGWELLVPTMAATAGVEPRRRVPVLGWAFLFGRMVFDEDAAARFDREATAIEPEIRDPVRLGCLALTRALAAGYEGDPEGDRWIAAARERFHSAEHAIGLGHVCFAEGAHRLIEGDLVVAASRLEESIEIFRAHGDHLGLVLAVSRLGELAWRRGDLARFVTAHEELLELGHQGRSAGVVAGATARLAVGRLEAGDHGDAEELARAALASTSGSFMPVVNGYAFQAAGLVNLALDHVAEGRAQLATAIDAFRHGAGQVGVGQAVLCWVALSRSYVAAGERDAGAQAAADAVELASATGDPWIQAQADEQAAAAARP